MLCTAAMVHIKECACATLCCQTDALGFYAEKGSYVKCTFWDKVGDFSKTSQDIVLCDCSRDGVG